jgi:hypothetical protein
VNLGWKNWYQRKQVIYSNYHLYKIPYYYLESVRQFDYMRDGVALLDEIWRVIDSRFSRKTINKFVGDILAKSRKRSLVYIFTAQVIDTIDKRIRKVMDFTNYTVSNRQETVMKVLVFRTGYAKTGNYMKTFYYTSFIPFMCYDSNEEIDMEDDTESEEPCPMPKLIWQEGKYRCLDCGFVITMDKGKCNECDSKNLEPIEPIFFNTWEEADKFASDYWEKESAALGLTMKTKL